MGGDCKDCIQVDNLKCDITNLRNDVKEIFGRLGDVETTLGRKEEQIETIFNLLKDIKDSIKGINEKLSSFEKKPAEDYSKIKLAIITSICATTVGAILGLIFAKI